MSRFVCAAPSPESQSSLPRSAVVNRMSTHLGYIIKQHFTREQEPMSFNTDDFNSTAKQFCVDHAQTRVDLEKCLESRQNEDINFICQAERANYLLAIAQTFCKPEYELGVRCQKDAKEAWASKCFPENVRCGQCADGALRRLYIYHLEHDARNPAAEGGAAPAQAQAQK